MDSKASEETVVVAEPPVAAPEPEKPAAKPASRAKPPAIKHDDKKKAPARRPAPPARPEGKRTQKETSTAAPAIAAPAPTVTRLKPSVAPPATRAVRATASRPSLGVSKPSVMTGRASAPNLPTTTHAPPPAADAGDEDEDTGCEDEGEMKGGKRGGANPRASLLGLPAKRPYIEKSGVDTITPFRPGHYKFCVLKRNNSQLVRRALQKRPWWLETAVQDREFNFKWKSTSHQMVDWKTLVGATGSGKRLVNHFEFHRVISTKVGIITNVTDYYENVLRQDVFSALPLTYVIENGASDPAFVAFVRLFQQIATRNKAAEGPSAESPEASKPGSAEGKEGKEGKEKKESKEATPPAEATEKKSTSVKDGIALKKPAGPAGRAQPTTSRPGRAAKPAGDDSAPAPRAGAGRGGAAAAAAAAGARGGPARASVIGRTGPVRALATATASDPQNVAGGATTHAKWTVAEDESKYNMWILKPTGKNCGRGIQVFDNIKQIMPQIADFGAVKKQWVIQKYMERPLLIHGRKFDIRCYVVVNDKLDVFFYDEGYIRTSCEMFRLGGDAVADPSIHLTNNAIQKHMENYARYEEGNQLSFADFNEYIKTNFPQHNVDLYDDMLPRMKELAKHAFMSVREKLNPENRKFCFELFGMDYMIDENMKVWLIEVNTNPCLEEPSALLRRLLPQMIDDMVKISIDPHFPPPKKWLQENESFSLDSMDPTHCFDILYATNPADYPAKKPIDRTIGFTGGVPKDRSTAAAQ